MFVCLINAFVVIFCFLVKKPNDLWGMTQDEQEVLCESANHSSTPLGSVSRRRVSVPLYTVPRESPFNMDPRQVRQNLAEALDALEERLDKKWNLKTPWAFTKAPDAWEQRSWKQPEILQKAMGVLTENRPKWEQAMKLIHTYQQNSEAMLLKAITYFASIDGTLWHQLNDSNYLVFYLKNTGKDHLLKGYEELVNFWSEYGFNKLFDYTQRVEENLSLNTSLQRYQQLLEYARYLNRRIGKKWRQSEVSFLFAPPEDWPKRNIARMTQAALACTKLSSKLPEWSEKTQIFFSKPDFSSSLFLLGDDLHKGLVYLMDISDREWNIIDRAFRIILHAQMNNSKSPELGGLCKQTWDKWACVYFAPLKLPIERICNEAMKKLAQELGVRRLDYLGLSSEDSLLTDTQEADSSSATAAEGE